MWFHLSLDPRGFKLQNIRKLDEEEQLEYGDSDDDEFRVSLPLKKNKPKRVRNYKNKMENWENAEVCNKRLVAITLHCQWKNASYIMILTCYFIELSSKH